MTPAAVTLSHAGRVLLASDLAKGPRLLALALLWCIDRETGGTTRYPVSVARICLGAGCSRASAFRHLATLERLGFIRRELRRNEAGAQIENRYWLDVQKLGRPAIVPAPGAVQHARQKAAELDGGGGARAVVAAVARAAAVARSR